MMLCLLAVSLLSSLIPTVSGEIGGLHNSDDLHSFKSRPDLRPPKLWVKKHRPDDVAPGYFFTAPYAHSELRGPGIWAACQAGPAIYDGDGELIWTGGCEYGSVYDFKAADCGGRTCMSFDIREMTWPDGSRHGTGVILDNTYQVEKRILIDNNFDLHEFHILPGGKTVVFFNNQIREYTFENLGFEDDVEFLRYTTMYEYDLKTDEVIFKWETPKHLALNQSTFHPPTGPGERPREKGWDFDHANSIDKNDDGDYIMSFRHTNCLLKVSGEDGEIMWQIGGHDSDFEMGDTHFSRQHHVRIIESERDYTILSVFDNASGEYGKNDEEPPSNKCSRSLIIKANHPKGKPTTVETLRKYDRPDGELTELRGSTQILSNGNVFSGWSKSGYQSEHTEDGELVEESGFTSERYDTYRSYKYELVAKPSEPPHVTAEVFGTSESPMTVIYVSWNGATEVKSWNFYSTTSGGRSTFIGNAPKKGFETTWAWEGYADKVWVEALGVDGRLLGKTEKEPTRVAQNPEEPEDGSDEDKFSAPKTAAEMGDWQNHLKDNFSRQVEFQVPAFVLALIPLGALLLWFRRRVFCAPLLRTTRRHLDGYRGVAQEEMNTV